MPTLDPRVDAYIAKAAEFARPILIELRARMHAAYRRASQYEWMFWDSAWRLEAWPV